MDKPVTMDALDALKKLLGVQSDTAFDELATAWLDTTYEAARPSFYEYVRQKHPELSLKWETYCRLHNLL